MTRLGVWMVALVIAGTAIAFATNNPKPRPLPDLVSKLLRKDRNITEIRTRQRPLLTAALDEQGLDYGAPVYLRIFKEEAVLELWVQKDTRFELFDSFDICNYSGKLGPKLKEGDRQAPEGFYRVNRAALNPNSSYHLSFNLGFPNAFDRAHGRTGSFLMVHGDCVSIGCYAMTDAGIEEIYVLVEAALKAGQPYVPVHAFPFRMSPERMAETPKNAPNAFWSQLVPAYAAFEETRQLPKVRIEGKRYKTHIATEQF